MADKDTTLNWLAGDQAAMQPETFVNPMVDALIRGSAESVMKPGQYMTPNPYPPGSEEASWYEDQRVKGGHDWATKTAMGMMGTGAPMAENNAAGIFGGKLAKTADLKALQEAQHMAHEGRYHPDEILQSTGWFRSPADHKWRFEIPDNKMKLNYMPPSEGDMATSTMANFVTHPELFKAYPQLQNLKVSVTNQAAPVSGKGMFDPHGLTEVMAPDAAVAKSILAHELQHGVQGLEKFSFGANPQHYQELILTGLEKNPSLLPKSGSFAQKKQQLMDVFGQAYPLYRKTAGEVEARNVQDRLLWSPKERQQVPPWYSQDTPYREQIHNDPWGPNLVIRALKP